MKPEELSEHIGEIDEELIAGAKKKRRTDKNIFMITGSIAACAVIAVTVIFLASGQSRPIEISVPAGSGYTEKGAEASTGITTGGADPEIPHTEESEETVIESFTSSICYVRDGSIEKTPVEHEATPQAVFELWKKMNNIGDDVRFVSVTLKTSGSTEETEYSGQGVATYHAGADLTFNLTITKNIENYYSRTGKRLLLNSLERTMYEASEVKYGEFNLILAEG